MSTPRQEEIPLRVVGIDPGTDTLGFAVLDLYLSTGDLTVTHVETIELQKMLIDYRHEEQVHGSRTARLVALEERLFIYFEHYQPHAICAESPFLSRFPQAFAALTECISFIRRAVMRYDRYKPLEKVDPPTAKKAVGATIRRGMTKDDVKTAIAKLPLRYADGVDLNTLDEHSVDALAVAYHQVLIFKNQIPN